MCLFKGQISYVCTNWPPLQFFVNNTGLQQDISIASLINGRLSVSLKTLDCLLSIDFTLNPDYNLTLRSPNRNVNVAHAIKLDLLITLISVTFNSIIINFVAQQPGSNVHPIRDVHKLSCVEVIPIGSFYRIRTVRLFY